MSIGSIVCFSNEHWGERRQAVARALGLRGGGGGSSRYTWGDTFLPFAERPAYIAGPAGGSCAALAAVSALLSDGICSLCADARISNYFGVQKGLSVFYTAQ